MSATFKLCALALFALPFAQASVLYTTLPGDVSGFNRLNDTLTDVAVPFTPAFEATLDSVSLLVGGATGGALFDICVAADGGTNPGACLETIEDQSFPAGAPVSTIFSFSGATVLSAGIEYWIWVARDSSSPGGSFGDWRASDSANGSYAYRLGANWTATNDENDLPALLVEGTATPEPASWALAGLGLLAAAGLRTMRKRKSD